MSFPCSHTSNTSIHLSYVGSSKKQGGYFWVVVDALLFRKGHKYSCINFYRRTIEVVVSECRRSANTECNHNFYQNCIMEGCSGSCKFTLNVGSYLAPTFFGRSRPFSIHFALAFFNCNLKFSVITLSFTWMFKAFDTLINMLGSHEYMETTSNLV